MNNKTLYSTVAALVFFSIIFPIIFSGCNSSSSFDMGGGGKPSGGNGCQANNSIPLSQQIKWLKNKLQGHSRQAEARLYQLNNRIKGFGGMYIDEQGKQTVLLTNMGKKSFASAVVRNYLKVNQGRTATASRIRYRKNQNINFKKAKYTFRKLAVWRELATAYLLTNNTFPFVLTTDVNEKTNRVDIGINEKKWNDRNLLKLKSYINNRLNIPSGAVNFKKETYEKEESSFETSSEDKRFKPLDGSIEDRQRPIVGGLKIYRRGSHRCTIGFLGRFNGKDVFLTAEHCTENAFGFSVTSFFQDGSNQYDKVGTEIRPSNQPKSIKNCRAPGPACWPCRWSDSAIIAFKDKVKHARGYIVKTKYKTKIWEGKGSTEIDQDDPVFTIVGLKKNIEMGMTVEKVGYKTGWTSGKVTETCYDSRRKSHRVVLICQNKARNSIGSGDSGSAVFTRVKSNDPNIKNPVALVGIEWGDHDKHKADGYSIFSPISGVLKDFKGLAGLTINKED